MSESEKILFHYTSLEGLLGIIKSGSIWATNILYLNDASELNYSIGLFKNEVRKFLNEKNILNALSLEYQLLNELIEIIDDEKFFNKDLAYFVSSFSEEKDLLSQWRGYCPKGIGFSLGFKLSKLKECGKCLIKPCLYDELEQRRDLRKIIEDDFEKVKTNSNTNWQELEKFRKNYITGVISKFIGLAPTFKHRKFIEEKEWRAIVLSPTNEGINFRSGQTMIVPYIEIHLPRDAKNLIINHIIVGPTHEPILSMESVEMLLKVNNVIFDAIEYSTIPFRNC